MLKNKMTKILLALCIVSTTLSINYCDALACSKKANCYSKNKVVVCGEIKGVQRTNHAVREPNGYVANCVVTEVGGPHTIKCEACKSVLYVDNYRRCEENHSNTHCYSKKNLCKY